ncbi:MAG: ammonia-forming cytochrome c nitrite reductase subunit c552 [Eubacteriaceae bacterium]|nr:ammonia-forming cytochrome c nitrite reductase subunit c552 [Eubacteriaceae bacterium]
MKHKSLIIKILFALALIAAAVVVLSGILNGKDLMYHLKNRSSLGPLSRSDISYLETDAPSASSKDGTVTAADWASIYPYITATMGDNDKNSYVVSYLEQDPYLMNIYEGFGFAKDYGSARGHNYTLEDVHNTERPHAKANCLTCKTPNFAKLVNDQGISVYSMSFAEAEALMEENVSCYTCHGNDAGNKGQITITHSYVITALGDAASAIDPSTLSCGQCHIEYYFTPSDSETMMPYDSVAAMTPEAILAYYDSLEFYDWIQPSTGTKMLKAQHPEMETYLYGKHASLGLNCADCHMPMEMAEDGTVYHSHYLVSPLESESLLSYCATCHQDTDMKAMVKRLQERVTARETEVGNKLSDFKNALAKAVEEGKMPEAELDEIRNIHRQAQWYFDFCYVENAEGAHNSDLAFSCLDKSEELIDRGMEMLGK